METAGDKPVQRKQDAGQEFPLWIINIDKDECESGRQIFQGDSQREKMTGLKRLKNMSLNWEDQKEIIFRKIKKDETKQYKARKGSRHKFKQWSNIVLRIIYANKSATEVMNEEKDLSHEYARTAQFFQVTNNFFLYIVMVLLI